MSPEHYRCIILLSQSSSWFRVFQKLAVAQLVEKFPDFYGTQKFIIMFTRARHWALFWARWIKSISSHPFSL